MQTTFHEKFIVDKKGNRTAVVIDAQEYKRMLRLIEEAEVIKIVQKGEEEFKKGKLKSIHSLSELDA